jgi:hypothetical protein
MQGNLLTVRPALRQRALLEGVFNLHSCFICVCCIKAGYFVAHEKDCGKATGD